MAILGDKRILMAVIWIILLAAISGCQYGGNSTKPFPNEPAGFHGIPWGASLKEIEGLHLLESNGDSLVFARSVDVKKIGDSEIEDVRYRFYKDRFAEAILHFKDNINYHGLKDQLFFLYGKGDVQTSIWRKQWVWSGEFIDIQLEYSTPLQRGTVTYLFRPIILEEEEDLKAAAAQGLEAL